MKVGQHCKRQVIVVDVSADIVTAAMLMRTHHIGFLVVLDERNTHRVPVGVITDRDIVVQIDAKEVDPRSVKVGEVMTPEPVVASESDELTDLLQAMRMAGIRRAPVVDTAGHVTGVIAVDDVVDLITTLMCDITGTIANEQRMERRARVT